MLVGVLDLLELRRLLERGRRLVGERAEDLQAIRVGPEPVGGVVGPDVADAARTAVVEGHEQPVVLPGVRAAAVELRAVPGRSIGQDPPCLVVREQEAALDLELRLQQLFELVRSERDAGVLVVLEPDGGGGAVTALAVQQLHGDLVETECVRDGTAHLREQRIGVACLVQASRHLEQALECVAAGLGASGLLRGLDCDRCVLGDGDEHVDLVSARLAARERLVDGENPEQSAVAAAHRHEERVVGMPRPRVVADLEIRRVHAAASTRPSRTPRKGRRRRRAARSAGRGAAPSRPPVAPGRAAPHALLRCRRRC